jgi:hypothetical protein
MRTSPWLIAAAFGAAVAAVVHLAVPAGVQRASVVEATQSQWQTLLEDGRVSVVQIASDDESCGCRPGDVRSLETASLDYGRDVAFVRVKWSSCQTAAGPVCRQGAPMLYVHLGQGMAGAMSGSATSGHAQQLKELVRRARRGPPALFVAAAHASSFTCGNDPAFVPLRAASPEEARAIRLASIESALSVAASVCANFNPAMSAALQSKVTAWRDLNVKVSRVDLQSIAGRVDARSLQEVHDEALRPLVEQLAINEASSAGCAEFSRLLDTL